jgi:hypothetical protein
MNNEKQYLFTANGSYFGKTLIAATFLFPIIYGVIDRGGIDYNETNILMFPVGVALLLAIATVTEACMMIRSKNYLFAYNVDKAICLSLDKVKWDSAVAIARKLYGPVFDVDCAQRFSSTPKSPFLRNIFYFLVIVMFIISMVSPVYHLIKSFSIGTFSSKLIATWIFILFDGLMIVNRLFYRSSIRRFWAWTLGDNNFCSILNFELSKEEKLAMLPHFVVIDDKEFYNIPGYTKRIPSKKKIILVGIILIILVVFALNS